MPSSEKDGIVGRGKMAGGEKIKEFIATDESKCWKITLSSQKREWKHKHAWPYNIIIAYHLNICSLCVSFCLG